MRSPALQALPDGSYVKARFSDGDAETVRLLYVRAPTADELLRGHGSSNRVYVRRFLLGGWRDMWVYPRDVLEVTQPDPRTLAVIEYVEREVEPRE